MDSTLIIVVAVALFFDFTNGFHDTANAISTVVATKALPPRVAVAGAAILNFLGAFLSLHVAATIAGGIIQPSAITLPTVLAALVGAIIWNLITWRVGIPSSSSHALVGGIIGAGTIAAGGSVIQWSSLQSKVLIPSIVSPIAGLLLAGLVMLIVIFLIKRYKHIFTDTVFRRFQIVSGGLVALMHGTNDAQKTMGIIALALLTVSVDKHFEVPLWVILASATAIAAGTWAGGWRIIQTMGEKITKLDPSQGFVAQSTTAATLATASQLGFPVSTTQTISGSIVGVGVAKGSTVNKKVIKHILLAWLITIPSAALFGAAAELIVRLPGGVGILTLISLLIVLAIFLTRNWTVETRSQLKSLLSIVNRQKK